MPSCASAGPHGRASAGHVSLDQLKVMSAIETCRNRHCPKRPGAAARQWLEERRAEL